MALSAAELIYVYKTGLNNRPEYYSGRGNNRDDLNSQILEKVYGGIKKEHGDDAAKAMVNMVNDLNDTSATGFLVALYTLERNGWKHSKSNLPQNGAEVLAEVVSKAYKSEDETQLDIARLGVMEAIFRQSSGYGDEGHSFAVTGAFLQSHRREISGERREMAERRDGRHYFYG